MRPLLMPALMLALGGCSLRAALPFTAGPNRNQPISDAPNMQRILGGREVVTPLVPEPGNIWSDIEPGERSSGLMQKRNAVGR